MEKSEFEYLGPYRVEGLLGRGGMGSVYKGIHAKTSQVVAIKVIASDVANRMEFRRRFAAEIESLRRLRHPHIVQLIGYGEEQGLLFYSMEFVEGLSLHSHLLRLGRLPWPDVVQIGIQVTAALKHAHDMGIIHRDLKPANLMLNHDGQIKLTDFGIAKLFGATDMTIAGSVLGTADYMSPEQAEGKHATVRSDLYSLGCVLYALLLGHPPFSGKSLPEVLYAVRYTDPPETVHAVPDAPSELHTLLADLLKKDPAKRPPTALAIGNRLKAIQPGGHRLRLAPSPPQKSSQPAKLSSPPIGQELTSIDLSDDVEDPGASPPAASPGEHHQALPQNKIANATRAVSPAGPPRTAAGFGPGSFVGTHTPDEAVPLVPVTHFTHVTDTDARVPVSVTPPAMPARHADWLHYGSIAGLALLMVLTIAYAIWMLQPQSADTMYAGISATLQSGNDALWIDELDTIADFLQRYPQDPRAAELQIWFDEGELTRAVRRLERRSSNQSGEQLSAIEQGFLSCMRARAQGSANANNKLRAFLNVVSDLPALSAQDRRYVELARHALERSEHTKTQVVRAENDLSQLIQSNEKRLRREQLADFYRNLLELYNDQPWAQEQLARVRQRLDQL